MKIMFKELFRFKWLILLLFFTVIGSVIGNLALPMYLSDVINISIPNNDISGIISIGGIMLIFALVGTGSSILTGFLSAIISVGMGKKLRNDVFRKVQYFSQTEFDNLSTSSLITRTNNDVLQVQTFVNMLLRMSLMAPIMCIGGIIMAIEKSSSMSMILFVSMPMLLIFVVVIAKKAMPLSTAMQKKLDEINLVIREKLTGIRVARTFSTEDFEERRFEAVNKDFMDNSIKMNTVMAIIMPGLNLILYSTMLALLAFGGYKIINNVSIPIGDIIAVIQYVMQIMMSVVMLSMIFIVYPRASVSANRINEVLQSQYSIRNKENAIKDTDKKGYIEFKNVSFSFPNADKPAIYNISFKSNPDEVTAIIGSTGSGKSTLINLIPRFYDVSDGEIFVDGVNIKDMDIDVLRAKIGFVPQKAFLFKGSIKDNISYGNPNKSEDMVENALKIAQSYDFVMEKEDGVHSLISQGGTNVSGGQKQRLAIARAISRKPEIYIFDDSFSALDFKTDSKLRKALFEEIKGSTVIIVAQRVSTIKNADRIIVLEDGNCVGIGRHEELLENCEVYKEIVYSQLSKEEV